MDAERHSTRHSLIARVIDGNDKHAWDELYVHYRHFISYLLEGYSISPHEKEDVTQEVLIFLMRDLQGYDRSKGKFRNWLATVVKNTALMSIRKKKTKKERMNFPSDLVDQLETVEGESEFIAFVEKEWVKYITDLAFERLKKNFSATAIEVFSLALDGYDTQEIMRKLELSDNTVYSYRVKVKQAMVDEISAIRNDLEYA